MNKIIKQMFEGILRVFFICFAIVLIVFVGLLPSILADYFNNDWWNWGYSFHACFILYMIGDDDV